MVLNIYTKKIDAVHVYIEIKVGLHIYTGKFSLIFFQMINLHYRFIYYITILQYIHQDAHIFNKLKKLVFHNCEQYSPNVFA